MNVSDVWSSDFDQYRTNVYVFVPLWGTSLCYYNSLCILRSSGTTLREDGEREEQEREGLEQKRRRWGGLGEEEDKRRSPSQPAGWGEKEWWERKPKEEGEGVAAELERLRVCVKAKWGLYKWKQMPGIMNLSGRRWEWRWWSTWLPGWLSFTLLLSPLIQRSEGEKEEESVI